MQAMMSQSPHCSENRSISSQRPAGLRSRSRWWITAATCLALAPACKKDSEKTEAKPTEAKVGEAAPTAEVAAPADGAKAPANDSLPRATRLQRGEVLGHFLLPNPSKFLIKLKEQVVPASQASFVDESFLRSMAGAGLGTRSKVATNVDLKKPVGCALVDSTVNEAPIACLMGYQGGAEALVADLGPEGKQADAAGHAAKYVVDGNEIFIDDLAGTVVASNHAEVFGKAKGYLEANLIGRAAAVVSDLEVVAFPAAAAKRYEDMVKPFLEQATVAPKVEGDSKVAQAFANYSAKGNQQNLQTIQDMDQLTAGLELGPTATSLAYAVFPVPGSQFETMSKVQAGAALDPKYLRKLPKTSWGVAGFSSNWQAAWSNPSTQEVRDDMIEAYASAVGHDVAETKAAVEAFIAEAAELYSGKASFALAHQGETLGGIVLVAGLNPGKNHRESYKAWAAKFTPEAVLGADGAKELTWSFQFDAAKVGDHVVDRWVIEPTDASKAKLRKENPKLKEWETKLGGLKLVINRVEVGDQLVTVIAPAADDQYVQSAVDAVVGSNNLEGDPGLTKALERGPKTPTSLLAFDVRKMLAWIGSLMPAEERAKIPTSLGSDLSDVSFAVSVSSGGVQSGEFVISQPLIDQMRALGNN